MTRPLAECRFSHMKRRDDQAWNRKRSWSNFTGLGIGDGATCPPIVRDQGEGFIAIRFGLGLSPRLLRIQPEAAPGRLFSRFGSSANASRNRELVLPLIWRAARVGTVPCRQWLIRREDRVDGVVRGSARNRSRS
jgi:hypothetical protein